MDKVVRTLGAEGGKRRASFSRPNVILLVIVFFVGAAWAQQQNGQVTGVVTDPTGAVVPGAKIAMTNPDVGAKFETTSNNIGVYILPNIPFGRYSMTVTAAGFSTYNRPIVEIATGTTATVNIVLTVGSANQEVTVEAQAIVLESTTSSLGTAVEEKLKSDIPNLINGGERSPFSYIYVAPTVNDQRQLTIGGSRGGDLDVLVDGMTSDVDTNSMGNGGGGLPSVESIGEFKLLLNSIPAEYGRSSGAAVTFATKSGTNTYHAVGYEFLRNDKLDARNWQAATRSPYKQNEYGVAGGGPVWIPKLYNGKDKTFFWFDWTGYKYRTAAASGYTTLPTPAERGGNYSANPNIIYDALNLFTDASGNQQRTPFPGNVIPASRISPVSAYFLKVLPLPSLPGETLNYVGSSTNSTDSNNVNVKADQYLGEKNRISFFYQYSKPTNNNGAILGSLFGTNTADTINRGRLEWDYTITPSLINSAEYGFTRHVNISAQNSLGQNIGAKAGLTGYFDGNCPDVTVDRLRPGETDICGSPSASTRFSLVNTVNESLLWTHGGHTVKGGIQFIRWNSNVNSGQGSTGGSPAPAVGLFRFFAYETANTSQAGGTAWASFTLGYPDYTLDAQAQAYGIREAYFAPFLQDDWRISRKLTINMGLRWDIDVPYSEVQGREATFNPREPNPGATGELGAVAFYGTGPGRLGSNRVGKIDWHEFGPRLGLAYQINPKTVFRAFWGIIDVGIQNGNADFADRTGFYALGQIPPPANAAGIAYNWTDPFPKALFGNVPSLDPTLKNGQTETYQNPLEIGRTPQLYMYSASVQRQLKGNILLEVAYLANYSKHDSDHTYPNELNPIYWPLGAALNAPLNSAANQALPVVQAMPVQAGGIHAPFPQFNTSQPLYQSLLSYPQYTQVVNDASPTTSSSYNAGYVKFQKRFSQGLTFLASYNLSKYLSDNTWSPGTYGSIARNYWDRRLDKQLRMGNNPNRLVLSYSYDLPFGPGQKFLANTGFFGKMALGGWTISGIQVYENGEPAITDGYLSIPVPTTPSITTSGSHANRVLGVPVQSNNSCGSLQFTPGNPNNPKRYLFNAGNAAEAAATGLPLAYSPEGDYQFGNGTLVDPHAKQCPIFNEDITIRKDFPVVERLKIQLGADFFNLLNRHTWSSSPGGQDVSAAQFGLATPYQPNGPRVIQMHVRIAF
jgi:hypothetical protein